MNTNSSALFVSSDVSDKNSERAELPRNRFIDCDFDGVGLKFCRLWGVPLQNGKPGDLDPNVLFLSVNLIGEVRCFFFNLIIGEAITSRRPGHFIQGYEISGVLFCLPSLRFLFLDLETLIVR